MELADLFKDLPWNQMDGDDEENIENKNLYAIVNSLNIFSLWFLQNPSRFESLCGFLKGLKRESENVFLGYRFHSLIANKWLIAGHILRNESIEDHLKIQTRME